MHKRDTTGYQGDKKETKGTQKERLRGKRGEIQGHKKETGGTFMSHTRGTPQGTRGELQAGAQNVN